MAEEREFERMASREEAATALRRVADGVLGGIVRIGETDEIVDVAIPAEMELEIEYEVEDDERSLEVELEWPADVTPPEASAGETPSEASAEEATNDAGTEADGVTGAEAANEAAIVEEPPTVPGTDELPARGSRFEVFQDRADEWRWRLVHWNGNIIATSGEGYTRKHNAQKGLQSVIRNAPSADIVEGDGPQE